MHSRVNGTESFNLKLIKDHINDLPIATTSRILLDEMISEYEKDENVKLWQESEFTQLAKIYADLMNLQDDVRRLALQYQDDMDSLSNHLIAKLKTKLLSPNIVLLKNAIQCLLKQASMQDNELNVIFINWYNYQNQGSEKC